MRRLLEGEGQRDELRLAEREAHKGDIDRQPEGEARRHTEEWKPRTRRRARACEDEVIAVDQVGCPGWAAVAIGKTRVRVSYREIQSGGSTVRIASTLQTL